jgi:hypothetical protein
VQGALYGARALASGACLPAATAQPALIADCPTQRLSFLPSCLCFWWYCMQSRCCADACPGFLLHAGTGPLLFALLFALFTKTDSPLPYFPGE